MQGRKTFSILFLETFTIMASILLALWVNNWWEGRKVQSLVSTSLEQFRREIAANQERIRIIQPYSTQVLENLQNFLVKASQDPSVMELPLEQLRMEIAPHGFQMSAIQDTAWQTAMATQTLMNMNYDFVYEASTVYQIYQQSLLKMEDRLMSLIGDPENLNTKRFILVGQTLYIMYTDINSLHERLLGAYDRFLQRPEFQA